MVMAEKVLMLALSPTMETGKIVNWTKKEGDVIGIGDILCEVETDKATMEYESVNEGTLLKIVVAGGGEARVGQSIAVVGEKKEDISGILKEIEEESSAPGAGAAAEAAQPAGGSTSAAPQAGEAVSSNARTAAPSIQTVTAVESLGMGAASPVETAPPEIPPAEAGRFPGGGKASPVARKLALQHGIDLKMLTGSGPDGRVIKRDIEGAIAGGMTEVGGVTASPAQSGFAPGTPAQPYTPAEMTTQKIPLSAKRKVIAQRLSESKFSAPHYYLRTIVAIDELFMSRKDLNKTQTEKVSFNGFILKFVAEALKRHPAVNASWQGDHILQFGRADIGLAVAQPDGLITPIVRDCWNRGILSIDSELKLLVDRARSNKLKPEEYTGATFTVTNLGSYGIHDFTAVINPPGSAILAIGEARREPVVGEDDQVIVQTNMVLSLSCDHRVIDGAKGALFLQDLKAMMENPIRVLY
jgi:pyruvate dehydrogenase E2 component (dihydrolipoamide acetyltransferase)